MQVLFVVMLQLCCCNDNIILTKYTDTTAIILKVFLFRHFLCMSKNQMRFPGSNSGKEPACQCRRQKRCRFNPWVRKIPWRRKWWPTSVFLLQKSHGQRSLAGYSSWDCKELDTTKVTEHMVTVFASKFIALNSDLLSKTKGTIVINNY